MSSDADWLGEDRLAGLRRTKRWWMLFTVVGLALWIGAIFLVASQYDLEDQAGPVRTTMVVGGIVFFGGIFVGGFLQLRSVRRGAPDPLYERLAVSPIAPGEQAGTTRAMSTIGYVYIVTGAVVTALAFAAIVFDDERITRILIAVVTVIVIAWAAYAVLHARSRAFRAAGDSMRPLGLRLVETPGYAPNPVSGGGSLLGAMTYEGVRHGRQVTIRQTSGAAVTVVVIGPADRWGPPLQLPRSAEEMAALTGEPEPTWRGVTMEHHDGAVVVQRSGNGAGAWMLHDLLLAEAVAARG